MPLKKELSLPVLVLYGVGIILGAGIYVLIGKGAAIAGDSLWLSFVIAAVIASFTGLSYAELSGMFPKTAAEYVYTKKAFRKESVAFVAQWIMVFSLIVASSTVALGFGSYLFFITGINPIIGAAALLILLSMLNYVGIRESAKFNIIGTIVEMSGLVIVVIIGMFFIGSTDANFFQLPPEGLTGVLMATGLIFFAYIGFEDLVNLSEESKNAKKIMPKALLLSLVISTILYIFVSISSIAVIGSEALAASEAPITEVVSAAIPQASVLMSVIALFATANTVLAMLVVLSRMLYGLSCNSAFPAAFCKLGKRSTPYISVFFVMVLTMAFLAFGKIEVIASLTDIGIFLVYLFVNSSLIMLRYREPNTKRTFRSPINIGKFPVLALLGIVSAGLMLFHFDPLFILYELAIAFAGLVFYFAFSKIKRRREEKLAPLLRKSVLTSKGKLSKAVKIK